FVREQCAAPSAQSESRHQSPSQQVILGPLRTRTTSPLLRLAIVVGVDRYKHNLGGRLSLQDLRYAERDADEVAGLLKGLGYSVVRLTGSAATRDSLLEAFASCQKTTSGDPHPDSSFVFHFSGHGQLDPNDDESAYLILHDSDPLQPAASGLE